MNTKRVAVVALVSAMAAASTAEAGGGVRLNFGVPLGTFVATPSQGGGGAARQAGAHRKQALKKHKAAPKQAARHPAKPVQRVAKAPPAKPEARKPEAATDEAPRLTGSSALIQSQTGAEGEAVETPVEAKPEPPADEPTVKAEAPRPAGEDACKKFMPAIGMTVSVGCGE